MRRMTSVIGSILVLAVALTFVPTAIAADDDWLVRTRLIYIEPLDGAEGTLDTLDAEVESDLTIEVDLSYFFTDAFAIEAILATAAQEVTLGGETSLGSVYHAPATVLAQYHFNPEGAFKPYLGAGVNYTIFYGESGALENDFEIDSGSFGFAGQVGFDYQYGGNKTFNFDVKYIQIESDVSQGATDLGTVEVNPLVIGVGFGFRF